jgi:1,4-alpha-glucan branching enzyme
VLSYLRRDGGDSLIVVCNFTPVPREGYRLGVPDASEIATLLSSDDTRFGGSGYQAPARVKTENVSWQGFTRSIQLPLPPLAAVVLTAKG